jgi:hypothetical protein
MVKYEAKAQTQEPLSLDYPAEPLSCRRTYAAQFIADGIPLASAASGSAHLRTQADVRRSASGVRRTARAYYGASCRPPPAHIAVEQEGLNPLN